LSAANAGAGPLTFDDVAVEDLLVTGVDVGNSTSAESSYLLTYLASVGYDTSLFAYNKIDIGGEDSFSPVTGGPLGTNLWAIDFLSYGVVDPLYFLIKVGNGEFDHYLYQNIDSMQFGVVDLGDIEPRKGTITIESISHTSSVGTAQSVPEPGTLSLLLVGVAGGLVAARRRQRGAEK
jgi:hypothetical protein